MAPKMSTSLALVTTMLLGASFTWGLGLETSQVVQNFGSQSQTCVGYLASKQVLLVGSQDVTGKTCDNIQVSRPTPSTIEVKLTPHFESGNKKRDSHVQELLGGPEAAPVIMTIQVPVWNIPMEPNTIFSAALEILHQKNPVQLKVSPIHGDRLAIIVETKFSALNIARPKVGPFGLAGSVQDDLILFAQIPVSVIQDLRMATSNGGPS